MEDIEVDLDAPEPGEDEHVQMLVLPDGQVEVILGDAVQDGDRRIDAENLAESMEETELLRLGLQLKERVDSDIDSRKEWHTLYKEGLRRAGIVGEPDPATIAGGSTVVHPLLMEVAIQFQARAIEELFPPSGPVKTLVVGKSDERLEKSSARVQDHMNYQLTVEDEEYFDGVDQMLLVLPLAGSTFKKTYFDHSAGYVTSKFVPAEDVIIPYKAKSHRQAVRITHRFMLHPEELQEQMGSGFYRQVSLTTPGVGAQRDDIQDLADAAEPSVLPEEQPFTIMETCCKLELEGGLCPYVVSWEYDSARILSIRRNWRPEDERKRPRRWFTHYRYLPGLGVYGFGIFHAIGGLGDAATNTLRSLFDAAQAANWQGGFTSNDARLPAKRIQMQHGVWQGVDMSAEELSKAFFTPPFKEPSIAMFNLLGLVVEAGGRFGSITEAMVGEGAKNIPVGTTIARIEQGSKVYSAIHKRNHRAAQDEFAIRAELNRDHLEEAAEFNYRGSSMLIYRRDYDHAINVIPVSDPNIVSTAQRVAVAQAVVERASISPLYDREEAERRYLEALRVPDIDKLIVGKEDQQPLDPVTEGAEMMMGKAAKAFAHQNHDAHNMVHMGQVEVAKGMPNGEIVMQLVIAHMAEHTALKYQVEMMQQLGVVLPEPGAKEREEVDPEMEWALSVEAAALTQQMMQQRAQQDPEQAEAAAEQQLKMAQAKKANAEAEEVLSRIMSGGVKPEEQASMMQEQMRQQIEQVKQEASRREDALRQEMARAIEAVEKKAEQDRAKADADIVKEDIKAKAQVEAARIQAEGTENIKKLKDSYEAIIEKIEKKSISTIEQLDKAMTKIADMSKKMLDEDKKRTQENEAEKDELKKLVEQSQQIVQEMSAPKTKIGKVVGPDGKSYEIEVTEKQGPNGKIKTGKVRSGNKEFSVEVGPKKKA